MSSVAVTSPPMAEVESGHVTRTLRALELIAARPVTQSELAAGLGVHARTARRLLDRLVAEGYAAASGEGGRPRYAATLKIMRLVGPVLERSDVVRVAAPYVADLRSRTGESAHLSVPREDGVLRVVRESDENVVTIKSRVGELVPFHSTATGKALLAHLPDVFERMRGGGLERRTERTVVDPVDLLVELATIRERGYALDDREHAADLRCAAAAVFDRTGAPVAALGVSAPASRLPARGLAGLGELVAERAQALSRELGG
jgi:DNA-binding IclR family transcriptional regulator